jgi:thiamine phosphate synthase YjbQ (UPF0047 family)
MEIDFGVAVGQVAVRTHDGVEVVDLTARVEAFLQAAALEAGWVNVHSRHAAAGIAVNEAGPDLPPDARAGTPPLRTAQTLNVAAGRLQLPPRQRLLLVELDGPRECEVSMFALGERRREALRARAAEAGSPA